MTEIPEHLLRRSRERRAALSGGDAGSEAPAPAAPAVGPGAGGGGGGGAEGGPEGGDTSAPGTAVEPAAPAGGVVAVEEPAPPPYIAPTGPHKTKVPLWVMPVLIALPLWAFLYPSAFANHTPKPSEPTDPIALGQVIFHSKGCSGCHGNAGEGGAGPKLAGGEAKLTFPNVDDQISWVSTGSGAFAGKKYGDPNRSGGQKGPATGGMPPFAGTLSPAQISAVVQYEREKL